MFSVVKFLQSNTVECVPNAWLESDGNGSVCFWPRSKGNIKKMIQKQTRPESDWMPLSIGILYSNVDFQKGLEKAKEAEDTSNLESQNEETQTTSKRAHRSAVLKKTRMRLEYPHSSSDEAMFSDNNTTELPILTPSKFGNKQDVEKSQGISAINYKEISDINENTPNVHDFNKYSQGVCNDLTSQDVSMEVDTNSVIESASRPSNAELSNKSDREIILDTFQLVRKNEKMLDSIMKRLILTSKSTDDIKTQNTNISNRLSMSCGINPAYEDILDRMPPIPAKSLAHFDELETFLNESTDNFKSLVCILKNCGGDSAKAFSTNCISRLLDNSTGSKFNMKGKATGFARLGGGVVKRSFEATQCYKAILEAMKLNKVTENEDSETARQTIMKWLRNAGWRAEGGLVRNAPAPHD